MKIIFPLSCLLFAPLLKVSWLYVCGSIFWTLSSVLLVCWSVGLPWASQVVLVVKNPSANAGDTRDRSSISGSGWGRSPGEGKGNPLWYSCLENPMDRGAWWATVNRVAKSWARLKRHSVHVQVGLVVKNPPAMQETLVRSLVRKIS